MKTYRILFVNIIIFFHLIIFNKSFLFSIIIPIYNTGRYLDDCIVSLISQTIGFEKIQIILINDGSTDQSEEICLKYQNKYKENIIYIKTNHSGVSKARNVGMNYANGTFINFLDSDDKWDFHAFNNISLFFKKYNNIDFIAGRIKFFERNDNFHPLDYKFYKTRIVNLNQEYNSIQLSASSCFFKKTLIQEKYFKEDVYYCEDSRFVNTILLMQPRIGIIKEAIYYYRRRNDYTSAINNQQKNLEFYFGTLEKVYNFLLNSSIALYGFVLPFIQFLIIYDIFWRINAPSFKILSSRNLKKYKTIIENFFQKIDDKYFIEQKFFSNKIKLFALSKKYHRDLRYDFKLKNNSFIYSNYTMIDLNDENYIIEWKIINFKNNKLYLEAIDNLWLPRKKYNYFMKLNDKVYYPKYFENSRYDFYTMYGLIQKGRTIFFEIPLEIKNECQTLYLYISYMEEISEIFASLGRFSHIPPLSNGYFISGNFIIKYSNKRINIFQYNHQLEMRFENQYYYELKQIEKYNIINLRKKIKSKKNKYNKNYQIWIIKDKNDRAGDNGEFFFRYLNLKKPKGIKVYFVIEKNTDDFKRLRKYSNILDSKSYKYKRLFIESDKIISSFPDYWINNPFDDDIIYIRDLLHFDFIFLTNGFIKNDLSNSLNRFEKNFSLIVTSTKSEYISFLKYNYGYNRKNVVLTGMPRFDFLTKFKYIRNKEIVIIPTAIEEKIKQLRKYENNKTLYSYKFNLTDYFQFYNNLINDSQLLLIMKKYNYKGILCFCNSSKYNWNFHQNDIFSVVENCNYKKLLFTASLFVIDYLTIFIELGYMKKPVIYSFFDYDEYNIINNENNTFNYKENGFGPICNDLNCLIKEIISHIKNKCLLRDIYMRRIKKFFALADGKNNDRILFQILIKFKIISIENKTNLIQLILIIFFLILLYKFYVNRKKKFI